MTTKPYIERGTIEFPEYQGVRCYMMPVIQGDASSLPFHLIQYHEIIDALALPGERGEIGYLTIDESEVAAGASQRGYGANERTIHTEACLHGDIAAWGGGWTWGKPSPSPKPEPKPPVKTQVTWGADAVLLDPNLRALIANSIDDTCMVWDSEVRDTTPDGDLSHIADRFPRNEGRLMKACELIEIGIFTPHECIRQAAASKRQFLRLVGKGVHGRAEYFTKNPRLLDA